MLFKSKGFIADNSLLILLLPNLIPLLGVLLWDWDVFTVLLLFWLENVVIGIANIIKLLTCKDSIGERVGKSLFFTIHYGGFATGHALFLFHFFNRDTGGDFLSVWHQVYEFFVLSDGKLLLPILAILALQIFDVLHFWQTERATKSSNDLMSEPYKRVVVIHLALVFGGIFASKTEYSIAILIGLIVFKTIFDYKSWQKNRKNSDRNNKQNTQDLADPDR